MESEKKKMDYFRTFVNRWAEIFNMTPEETLSEISECVGKEMIGYWP